MINIVEARHDLVLDDVVERLSLKIISTLGTVSPLGGRYLPAVRGIEPLVPPPVTYRQVRGAVYGRLHPRGAARFIRPEWVVHPYVTTRVQPLGHGDVIVGQENDVLTDRRIVGELHDLLHQRLAALIGRMSLTGDDDLNRPIFVGE